MQRILLVLLTLVAVSLQATAIPSVDMAFPSGFSSLHVTLQTELNGTLSAQMRALADSNGNQDGQTTQAEVDVMTKAYQSLFEGAFAGGFRGGNVTLDGNGSTAFELGHLKIMAGSYPTASTQPAVVTLSFDLAFTVADAPSHTLRFKDQKTADGLAQATALTITAPHGFYITQVEGAPGRHISKDKMTMSDADTGANHEDRVIVFAKGSVGAPGLPFWGIAVLLVGIGFLRRRAA